MSSTDTLKLVVVLVTVLPLPLQSAIRIWSGTNSPYWSNPNNWVGGTAPIGGDSLEFPPESFHRNTINDLAPEVTNFDHILFTGVGYELSGDRIELSEGISQEGSGGTNRLRLPMLLKRPASIHCQGVFNELRLSGAIDLNGYDLNFRNTSRIVLDGSIIDSSMQFTGTVSKSFSGPLRLDGGSILLETPFHVREGLVQLTKSSTNTIVNALVVGDTNTTVAARAVLLSSQTVTPGHPLLVHQNGTLEINATEFNVFSTLAGQGTIHLAAGRLRATIPPEGSAFHGTLKGAASLHKSGTGELALSNHHPFSAGIVVESGSLRIAGSMSNAPVQLFPGATISGSGKVKTIGGVEGIIRPGPGVLECLDSVDLFNGQIDVQLDGIESGSLVARSGQLQNCSLEIRFSGTAGNDSFNLVEIGQGIAGLPFAGLPQDSILMADGHDFRISYSGGDGNDVTLEHLGPFLSPQLRILKSSAGEFFVAWPADSHGYVLEHSAGHTLFNWAPVDTVPIEIENEKRLPVDATNPAAFFRLKR